MSTLFIFYTLAFTIAIRFNIEKRLTDEKTTDTVNQEQHQLAIVLPRILDYENFGFLR